MYNSEIIARGITPLTAVSMERVKQDIKWGEQNHSYERWMTILMEEVGETAECVLEADPHNITHYNACLENLEYELIQVAAVCIAFIESMHRQELGAGGKQ